MCFRQERRFQTVDDKHITRSPHARREKGKKQISDDTYSRDTVHFTHTAHSIILLLVVTSAYLGLAVDPNMQAAGLALHQKAHASLFPEGSAEGNLTCCSSL
jgi:hypothetical protein